MTTHHLSCKVSPAPPPLRRTLQDLKPFFVLVVSVGIACACWPEC